jgi:hypothetical protein
MKAIFIDNYKAHAIIESRIESFADWEIHGRRGDGIISPVTVIKSPDDRSVLLTYDRNPESTNLKDTMESQFDDERAGLWFGDMLNKGNLEVFKEMGGGTVLYADQAKNSPKTLDIFLQKMHSVGRLDQASLDALKPMLTPTQVSAYENIIPTYEDIEKKKAEAMANSEYATYVYTVDENGKEIENKSTEKISNEDVNGNYTGEDAFNNGLSSESGVDPEAVDFNPDMMGDLEPEIEPLDENLDETGEDPTLLEGSDEPLPKPGSEYNLVPEGLREESDTSDENLPDEIPEINSNYEKASNNEMSEYSDDTTQIQGVTTEPENVEFNEDGTPKIEVKEINGTIVLDTKFQNILNGIDEYLTKYNMTIDEFMESVFKLKFLLNQIAGGKVPEETTSADIEQDPTELNETTNEVTEVPTEEPTADNMTATSNPVTNLLNAVADEMKNPENQVEDEATPVDDTNKNEVEVPDNVTSPDSEVTETISTESIDAEKELINQMMKISSNDTEFFNNMLPYKERLSMETINELVTTKMYDKILTGMTVYTMINVREDRARKLGLI